MYVCMYVCMYKYMYTYIYIYVKYCIWLACLSHASLVLRGHPATGLVRARSSHRRRHRSDGMQRLVVETPYYSNYSMDCLNRL